MSRDHVTTHLLDKYSEQPVAMGLASNGGMLEVFSSPEGESWTIMITMPNGCTYTAAAGESWETLPVKSGDSM